MKTRQCTGSHRSTIKRLGCEEGYLSLTVDYFMDCDARFAGEYHSRVPCRATEDWVQKFRERDPDTFCNRGVQSPDDPNLGFKWDLPLCRWTPECVSMGAAVASRSATERDEEVFRLECCTITDLGELVSPDGSNDLREMCETPAAASDAARAAGVWLCLALVCWALLYVL